MICVDVNIWNELVEDSSGGIDDPVGHLRRNSHRISEFAESRSWDGGKPFEPGILSQWYKRHRQGSKSSKTVVIF